ncbi:MAG: hypothetical protein AAF679_01615, partial [Pseudomonadota bacterium]
MRTLLLICLLGLATLAVAQSDETRENGFIISTIEDQLSNETRVIRLTGVEGALSSDATVARITVADAEGIWLEIEDAQITWNRGALLRGRVEIERLAAARIALPRLPQGEPSAELPSAQAEPFSLPDLPVSLRLDALETPLIELGAPVIGLAAELSATGKIALADGRLDAEFAMDRLDGPGGALRLTAGFSNTATGLELDLSLSEPENGVVANLLQIEGRPPLDLTLQGGGPLEALDLALDLKAQGEDLVDGRLVVAGSGGSYQFDADVAGRLAPLVPPLYAGFFEGESALRVEGSSGPDGLDLSTLSIEAATLSLEGRLRTGADGFPTDLSLTGRLGAGDGQPVLLPVAGGETRVTRGDLALTLGDRERWDLDLTLEGLETADLDVGRVELRGSGEASDLEQAERRALGLSLTGRMSGFETADRGVRTALGEEIDLTVEGGWQVGQPFVLDLIDLRNETAELTGSGEVFEAVFTGEVAAKIGALDALAPLAGRPLSGAADVTLQGRLAPLESGFDLTLAGGLVDVTTGTAQLDALLRGATEVSGRLARGQEGTILDRFRIEGPLLDVTADGRLTNAESDVVFEAALSDLAQIDPRTRGSATLVARAQGPTGSVEVETLLTLPEGRVLERPVEDLELSLTGLLRSSTRLTAQVAGSGQLDGSPLRLSA